MASQAQFFKIAARVIGRVIVDHARHRSRQKRGSGQAKVSLSQICGLALWENLPRAIRIGVVKVEVAETSSDLGTLRFQPTGFSHRFFGYIP